MGVRRTSTAEALQRLKSQLAVTIQAAVKAEKLSTVAAAQNTGVNRSEFSRLINGHLQKFGLERLVSIAMTLGIRCSLSLVLRKRASELHSKS